MQKLVTEEYMPGAQAETDEDLLEHVRATGGTTFHPTSTCMMGPHRTAVVDTALKVHGHGAGFAWSMPRSCRRWFRAIPTRPCIMIAEKAADMILRAA